MVLVLKNQDQDFEPQDQDQDQDFEPQDQDQDFYSQDQDQDQDFWSQDQDKTLRKCKFCYLNENVFYSNKATL